MKVRHGAQRLRICLGIVVTLASAAACAPSPEETQYTVEQYRESKELRNIQLAHCRRDPGRLGKTPNCVNATTAERLERIGSFKDLPPLDIPVPPSGKGAPEVEAPDPAAAPKHASDADPAREDR